MNHEQCGMWLINNIVAAPPVAQTTSIPRGSCCDYRARKLYITLLSVPTVATSEVDLTYASDTSEFIKTSEQTSSGRDARVTIGVTLAPVQECGFPGCLVFLSWSERSSKETEPKKHNAVRIKFRTRFAAGRFYEKFVADTFYEKSLLQTFYEKSLLQTHSMKKGLATNPFCN